jgi:F subunit of K+-transporting ATPase (Potass_KdpF)
MTFETSVALLLTIVALVYLLYALLRAEKL